MENPNTPTDEQRLAEFSQTLDSFKPEGFDEEKFNELKEKVVNYHKQEVQGLKINSAKMKEEKPKSFGVRKKDSEPVAKKEPLELKPCNLKA